MDVPRHFHYQRSTGNNINSLNGSIDLGLALIGKLPFPASPLPQVPGCVTLTLQHKLLKP